MKILGVLALLCLVMVGGAVAGTEGELLIESIQPLGKDEVVIIVNRGERSIDLTGWRLESSNSLGQEVKETLWLPRGCLLPAGGILRVHSGSYAGSFGDRSCRHEESDLPWTEIETWNDEADVAWLRDADGRLIDLYTYTAPETEPAPPSSQRTQSKPGTEEIDKRSALGRQPGRYCGPTRWPEVEPCFAPCCSAGADCCLVRVTLSSIELVYNECVGENWHFYVSAGPTDPTVFREHLPQVVYEDRFRGELFLEVGAGAVEQDCRPDRGWASRTVRLCCPPSCGWQKTIALEVPVRENECRYTGCRARWRFILKLSVEQAYTPVKRERLSPNADFTVLPLGERQTGDLVALDAGPSQGEGLRFEWDFDRDGRTDATGEEVSYRLAHAGMNLITLTVTDRWGRSDSITRGVRAYGKVEEEGAGLGLFWLTLPALAVGYLLAVAFSS